MLEFGEEVSTEELIALDRALRDLGTDAAWSALAKAHHNQVGLAPTEREAVLTALRVVLEQPPNRPDHGWKGLAQLASKLEHEQANEPDEPPPKPRARSPRK